MKENKDLEVTLNGKKLWLAFDAWQAQTKWMKEKEIEMANQTLANPDEASLTDRVAAVLILMKYNKEDGTTNENQSL